MAPAIKAIHKFFSEKSATRLIVSDLATLMKITTKNNSCDFYGGEKTRDL